MDEVKIDIFTCVLRTPSMTRGYYAASYKVVRNTNGKGCILGTGIVCERIKYHPVGFAECREAVIFARTLELNAPFLGGVLNTDKEESVPGFFLFPQTMFCV